MPTPRRSTDELLRARRERAAKLKAQIDALETRKKTEDRRRDFRRKIVVGAAVLAHAEVDASFRQLLIATLHTAVSRPADREVIADLISKAGMV